MDYAVSDIIADVRIAFDENEVTTPLIAEDSNTLSLDAIIRQKIVDAVRFVSEAAPTRLLSDAPPFTGAIEWSAKLNGVGRIILPVDFLRLVSFRMSDWNKAVVSAISETSPEYAMQQSMFVGVRGNTENPVCAVVSASNTHALEFYSSDSRSATITLAKYIPTSKIEVGSIKICKDLYVPVIYYAAALAAATFADQRAESLFVFAKNHLEV